MVSATNVTVTGTATDAVSGVSAVTAQVDGTTPINVPFDSSGNYSYTTGLTLGGSEDGPHTVTIAATNGVGKTTTRSVSFTLQSTAPTSGLVIAVAAPFAAAAVSPDGRLIGTVTETGTAVARQYSLDGGASPP